MKRAAVNLVCVVAAGALLGACAQPRTMVLEPAPADLLSPTHPVQISDSFAVLDHHGHVVAGAAEGIGRGMAGGALLAVGSGAQGGNPITLAIGLLLAPFAAAGGGLIGATAAHPAEETRQAVAAMEAVYADATLLAGLDALLEQRFRSAGFDSVPACARAPGNPSQGAVATDASTQDCPPANAVNRVRVELRYMFDTVGVYSPDLTYAMDATLLVAAADGDGAGEEYRWIYQSPTLDFFHATASGGMELRRQITASKELLANRIIDDLLLTRRPATVAGLYQPNQPVARFRPEQLRPGTVSRIPTDSQLASVTERMLGPSEVTPTRAHVADRGSGARPGTPVASVRERSSPRRIAMAPPTMDRDSPTRNCDVTAERDFRVVVEDVAGVAALEVRPPAANPEMHDLWDRIGTRYIPNAGAVASSGVFADADAVLLVGYHGIGGWYCIREKYELYLLDRRSGLLMTERADTSNLRARMRQLIGTWAGF